MALDTLADLRAELVARGFNYVDKAGTLRQDQWLNQAYLELCEEEPWPFLETTIAGPAPLAVPKLRALLSVYETNQLRELPFQKRRDLVNDYGDLSLAGDPSFFYIDNGVVGTFPVGGNLEVRYVQVPDELDDPADIPLVPLRFRNLIIDGAVRRGYWDSDNYQAAQAIETERQAGIDRMRQSLLWQNNAATEYVAQASGGDW